MIGRLSEKAAKWMSRKNYIDAEDEDVYNYGFFWLINIIEFFLLSVICGIVFKVIPGAIAFFISFLLLRLFGGGYHMDSETKCQISSLIIFAVCIFSVRLANTAVSAFAVTVAGILLSPVILIFCPVEFNSQDIVGNQLKAYKKICRIITAVILVLSAAAYFFKLYKISAGLSFGVIAESLLCTIGLIYNRAKSKV